MNLKHIITNVNKPSLYEKGTHIMWTDPYIAEQLQEAHLNPNFDLASRKETSIERTIKWIFEQSNSIPGPMTILELGCGPGLYTEKLAAFNHNVVGVDFSKRSIQTARQRAEESKLSIEYICGSYLELDLGIDMYDLIYIIFTDFCVLNPEEQKILLTSIYRAMKKGGLFLFDVNHPIRIEQKVGIRSWEAVEKGFWCDKPYLELHDSFPYLEEKAILEQHLVLTEEESRIYRFWTRFFDDEDLKDLLAPFGFGEFEFFNDILEDDGLWNGDNVLFCKTVK
jgi:SAM-dependent methyltransferase